MTAVPKVCFVPPALLHPDGGEADALAVAERPDNLRVRPFGGPLITRAAVERLKLWENGRRLRIRFLDGDPAVQAKVAAIAPEWEAFANLELEFVNRAPAEIRIGFGDAGFSWSRLGTDALLGPESQATMNYGWLEPTTGDREYRRVVLHEFGHALGMIHEHQNPAATGRIPWDRPKVYAHYARQGWSARDVDQNIFDAYDEEATNFSTFDPTSIMQYAVPDSLTVGSFAIPWNTELSETDKTFMRGQYPRGATGVRALEVGADPLPAEVTAAEVDTYTFAVPAAETHILTTTGATDVTMALHGPADAGALVAWDDDRGQGRNPRIVRKLVPGNYWVTIRHKDPAGAGAYAVAIRRRR